MSPAKRLSRQRFRALCERCAAYLGDKPLPLPAIKRMARYEESLTREYRRYPNASPFMAWFAAGRTVGVLRRLAR